MLPRLGEVGKAGLGIAAINWLLKFGEITQAEMNFSFMF